MKSTRWSIDLLIQYFYPENAAVAQFMTELAVELVQRGIDLRVLTSKATYHREGVLSAYEVYQDIPIHRFGISSLDKKRLINRLLSIATFLCGAFFQLFLGKKRDLLVVSNAPILGILGLMAKIFRRRKYICIIEDVYPDLAIKLNLFAEQSLICRLWYALNYYVYTNAECLIVLGKRMEEVVRRKLPKDTVVYVIHSWADGEAIRPLAKSENWFAQEHQLAGKMVVLYSGNHGLAHDLETLVEAADRLKDQPNILFLFIGDGGKKKQLIELAAAKKLENIRFLPYQPLENLPYSLTCGDISVVAMDTGIDGLVIPSKIYGSLAAQQAILGLVGDKTEVADILAEYHCGYVIPPKDVETTVRVLKQLAENPAQLAEMQQNARQCFQNNFRKEIAVDMYMEVFQAVLSGNFQAIKNSSVNNSSIA